MYRHVNVVLSEKMDWVDAFLMMEIKYTTMHFLSCAAQCEVSLYTRRYSHASYYIIVQVSHCCIPTLLFYTFVSFS